jgi:hypothetical protein
MQIALSFAKMKFVRFDLKICTIRFDDCMVPTLPVDTSIITPL